MRMYDPGKPLVFLHLPRTGGTSLIMTFREWFGEKMFITADGWPIASTMPGSLVRDHWCRSDGKAAEAIAGIEAQFVTFLRNPLQRLPSTYAHLRDSKSPKTDGGRMSAGEYARASADMLRGGFADMMPAAEYPGFFREFVFVGLAERYQDSLDRLADLIGKPRVTMTVCNASKGYDLGPEDAATYAALAVDELRIYQAVAETWEVEWLGREGTTCPAT